MYDTKEGVAGMHFFHVFVIVFFKPAAAAAADKWVFMPFY